MVQLCPGSSTAVVSKSVSKIWRGYQLEKSVAAWPDWLCAGHSPGVLEEVFVYPLDDVALSVLDADVVSDHEVRERAAIDQHQPVGC